MLRIDYIREFVKLADTMSFSKASEDLFISQPSLSRHISLLEAELGVRLVERSTRSVALTRSGTELYRDFSELLEAERSILEHAKALSSGYQGHLRICSPLYWDAEFIEPMILAFSRRCPGVKVELNICDPIDGMKQLLQGKADICTGFPIQMRSDVAHQQFALERLCAVMPADHPLAGRSGVSLRELSGERFLLLDMDENQSIEQTAAYKLLIRHGLTPSQIVSAQNPAEVALTIRQTGAVCLLLQSMGNLRRSYLSSVPLTDEDCVMPLYLFRRKDSADDAVAAFFDAAKRESEA